MKKHCKNPVWVTSGSMKDLPLHPADENGDRGVVDDVITDAP